MPKTSKFLKFGVFLHYLQPGLFAAMLVFFIIGAISTSIQGEESFFLSSGFKVFYNTITHSFFYLGVLLSVVIVSLIFGKSFKESNGRKLIYLGFLLLLPCVSAPFVFRSLAGHITEEADDY